LFAKSSFHKNKNKKKRAQPLVSGAKTQNRWAKAGGSRGSRTGRAVAAARRTSATTCLHQPTTRHRPTMRTPLTSDDDDDGTNGATAEDEQEEDAKADEKDQWAAGSMPSKFHLYQLSVQVNRFASGIAWICESL